MARRPTPSAHDPRDRGSRLRLLTIPALGVGALLFIAWSGLASFTATTGAVDNPAPDPADGGDTPAAVADSDGDTVLVPVDDRDQLIVQAVEFVEGFHSPDLAVDQKIRWNWLTVHATPSGAAKLETAYAEAVDQAAGLFDALNDPAAVSTVWVAPLAYDLAVYAPGKRAEVQVWTHHIIVAEGHEPRVFWQNNRVYFAWDKVGDVAGQWLVDGLELIDVPHPLKDQADQFVPTVEGFTPFKVAP